MKFYLLNPILCGLVVFWSLVVVDGRFKRCFTCRSRGDFGDCKDPFLLNSTTVEELSGVEASPCASGWCAKVVEGEDSDFDVATERLCLQRPPQDGEERCDDTIYEDRRVFMCFCRGDLCNSGVANKMEIMVQGSVFLTIITWWKITHLITI